MCSWVRGSSSIRRCMVGAGFGIQPGWWRSQLCGLSWMRLGRGVGVLLARWDIGRSYWDGYGALHCPRIRLRGNRLAAASVDVGALAQSAVAVPPDEVRVRTLQLGQRAD